jgi:hypothetical protein
MGVSSMRKLFFIIGMAVVWLVLLAVTAQADFPSCC